MYSAMSLHPFFLLIYLPSFYSLDCNCNLCGETTKFCTGDYCYLSKPDLQYNIINTGCVTPREDVWKDKTFPLCEKNHLNGTLCLCNNGDFCNTVEKFASITEKENYVIPKVMECINNATDDPFPRPPCNSSVCGFFENRHYDEFFDLTKPPFFSTTRSCPDNEHRTTFSINIGISSPQINSCLHIRWSPTMSEVKCFCNTPNCNFKIPMFNITKRGKGKCYLKTRETETMTCWGDFCFWKGGQKEDTRGCVDASWADDNFRLRLGESTLNDEYFTICEGDYCNSDILFPNGTIVGPSATRKYSTNSAKSFSLPSLFAITIAKLFM